jgi:2-keto-4-pentenoate hydratase
VDVSLVAEAFVTARRSGAVLDPYPGGELPVDLTEAYAVQDAAIALWDVEPAGWKAGLIAPERREPDGDERLVGPVWAIERAADEIAMPVVAGGFAAVEAEFVVRLDVAAEPGTWTTARVAALPHTIFAGIEIAGSPFPMINDLGPAVTASDFGNNAGLVIGSELPPDADPNSIMVRTTIDGRIVGEATGSAVPGGLLTSLAQTLTILGRRGRPVPAGTFFATGAVTGVHAAGIGTTAVITFGDLAPLRCRLVEVGDDGRS